MSSLPDLEIPYNEKANEVIEFITSLKHYEGNIAVNAGDNFYLPKWQENIVRTLMGTLRPDGRRQFTTLYLTVAKRNGKALALDTRLPTPTGWTTMGEVEVGDQLIDDNGLPCNVTATTDVMYNHKCYQVVFSDGCTITADANHEWVTYQHKKYRRKDNPAIVTTEQIKDSLHFTNTNSTRKEIIGNNHSISVAEPFILDPVELPIPPYTLGAWLGDGDTNNNCITCAYSDDEILRHIEEEGITTQVKEGSRKENCAAYLIGGKPIGICGRGHNRVRGRCPTCIKEKLYNTPRTVQSLKVAMRDVGVLGNKHIPPIYLRASYNQRLALLQGLMDTDGYISNTGRTHQCEFTTILPQLRDDVLELVRTLGLKPSAITGRSKLYGRDCGEKYRILFNAPANIPVFKLKRKLERQRPSPTGRRLQSKSRHIVDVIEVPSVPVKCVQVDSPSHLYLAGDSCIPTHNSVLTALLSLYLLTHVPNAKIVAIAANTIQAKNIFVHVEKIMKYMGYIDREEARFNGNQKLIEYYPTGATYQVRASNPDTLDGVTCTHAIIDELHRIKHAPELWTVLDKGMENQAEPLLICCTTAGGSKDGFTHQKTQYTKDVHSGKRVDPTWLGYVYETPPEYEIDDPEGWKLANPALGDFLNAEKFAKRAADAKEHRGEELKFRRFSLNQFTQVSESWIDLQRWDALTEPVDEKALMGLPAYCGLDVGLTKSMTAFVGCIPKDGKYYLIVRGWLPEKDIDKQSEMDDVDYHQWAKNGLIRLLPGDTVTLADVWDDIMSFHHRNPIYELAVDPMHGEYFIQQATAAGIVAYPHRQGYAESNYPCMVTEKAILDGTLVHGGNAVLRRHAQNAVLKVNHDGLVKLSKMRTHGLSSDSAKTDSIAAAVMAVGRAVVNTGAVASYSFSWDDDDNDSGVIW